MRFNFSQVSIGYSLTSLWHSFFAIIVQKASQMRDLARFSIFTTIYHEIQIHRREARRPPGLVPPEPNTLTKFMDLPVEIHHRIVAEVRVLVYCNHGT